MLKVGKRGRFYRVEGSVAGRRVRLSLGTANREAAILSATKVERAVVEGSASGLWRELAGALPASAFRKLAGLVGYTKTQRGPDSPTWETLLQSFAGHVQQRIARGKLRETTWVRYRRALGAFTEYLREQGTTRLSDVRRPVVEGFKAWRLAQICQRKNSRRGTSLDLDLAVLHRVFSYAVECELVDRNPVRMEGTPGARPERGAQPHNAEELARMRETAGENLLAFLLLRHTGMRGSDVVDLRWQSVDWKSRGIDRLTRKRSKRVWVPLHPELLFALENEYAARNPAPEEHVLLNPATGKLMTRSRLYSRIQALGRRAKVVNAHPHRFRDTLAVDLLLKGASPYDVAKLLGDTIQTVEEHYAPFVRELRERARLIVESAGGLEAGTDWAHPTAETPQVYERVAGESVSRILSPTGVGG